MALRKTGIASIDQDSEKLAILEKRSKKAKGIVGKLIFFPAGDGNAIYSIEAEKGNQVLVKWHDIHDAWTTPLLGQGGWFARNQIEPHVVQQDKMASFWEEAGKRQRTNEAKRRDSVVAAVLSDLGQNPDLFALAHWCWERGARQPLFMKDKRIYHNRETMGNGPFANDLARAVVDSKKFPALKGLDDIDFTMLADGFEDPMVFKKEPPAKEKILAKVREMFETRLGVVPPSLDVIREKSTRLQSTAFLIQVKGKTVGGLHYDPKTGEPVEITVAFQWPKETHGDNEYVRLM